MFDALRPYLNTICRVYLDDIVMWSNTIEEYKQNWEKILCALREHYLYALLKKTQLFALEIDFLGHHISAAGIEVDSKMVERVVNWPTPYSTNDVRAFLGLVRYLDKFLSLLTDYTHILTPLTTKEAEKSWPGWSEAHQTAFQAIKDLIVSRECLTVIDHNNMDNNHIFVHCNASGWRTGATLSYGLTRQTACPVAFDSMQLKGAELNYPVHEKELLAIIWVCKKWHVNLIGMPFTVYTDHRTLENFKRQKDLSRRQARWQEFLGQYDFEIIYLPEEENTAADALSRLPPDKEGLSKYTHASISLLRISTDPIWLHKIRDGYKSDLWCKRLCNAGTMVGYREENGLMYVGDQLIISQSKDFRENLFRLVHDSFGHFGFEKSYATL